jgi:hypothetical protein
VSHTPRETSCIPAEKADEHQGIGPSIARRGRSRCGYSIPRSEVLVQVQAKATYACVSSRLRALKGLVLGLVRYLGIPLLAVSRSIASNEQLTESNH